ncbi:MAG: pyridoxamine 5'-phosphate oxidase family protein [Rhodospirillales bacterium]|nr:pyridoxamine 5'-phosphate oxidase family protein [Rhodospirillales bacterium]
MANADTVRAARALLRGARQGVLATVSDGQPHAALVTPATAPDLSPLLFLSGLSAHTRHLRTAPRCALLVVGEASEVNPQTAPRLTVHAEARPEPNPMLRTRWLAVHPYAGLYAGLADFGLWRLVVTGAHWVGGFALAARLSPGDLLPDAGGVAAVQAAAEDIIAHCNTDHAPAMAAIAGMTGARMVAVDVDGCDLAAGERVVRVSWRQPVADAHGVRAELVHLARTTRESSSASR